MSKIAKSREITDAHISFISLVNKAANKRSFAIVKADDGTATFSAFGPIVKVDPENHYVTGVVYEPDTEDTQGDHMSAEEIQKAAYWYAKHRGDVDIQHSFESFDGACEVESWVTKNDETIGDQQIKKGTWMATVEVSDPEIFEKIQKGEITGFSMGGKGTYVESDDDDPDDVEKAEKEGVLAKLKKWLGGDAPVAKGEVRDTFDARYVSDNFWNAWYALNDTLVDVYDPDTKVWGPETDMTKVQEALKDFTDIATQIFDHQNASIFKCADGEDMPMIAKAGKAMSKKNKESLKKISDSLSEFLSSFNDAEDGTAPTGESEEIDVTKEEMTSIVKAAVQEAMKAQDPAPAAQADPVAKGAESQQTAPETITKADVQAMIEEALKKQAEPQQADPAAAEGAEGAGQVQKSASDEMAEAVQAAVAKAMEPYLKQEGLPTNLNGADGAAVAKSQDECYLHGII